MAYDYKELEDLAVKAINKHDLIFIQEIIAYLPCASSTFYLYELEKSESIKEALTTVKIKKKVQKRKRWHDSDNASLQIASYKLMATPEELNLLTQQKFEHSGEVKHKNQIDATKLKDDTLRDLFENGIVENDSEPT